MTEKLKDVPAAGYISQPYDIEVAVSALLAGNGVAVQNGPVCALWLDGGNPAAVDQAYRIKEREAAKRLGLTLSLHDILPAADLSHIHPSAHSLMQEPDLTKSLLGGIAFLKFPITADLAEQMPDCVVSTKGPRLPIVQNWDPAGALVAPFVEAAQSAGVRWPAVTSLNKSGTQAAITSRSVAAEFATQHGLTFLASGSAEPKVTGSYPIIEINEAGVTLKRLGHGQVNLLAKIFNDAGVDLKVDPNAIPWIDDPSQLERQPGNPEESGETIDGFTGVAIRRLILETLAS